MQWRQAVVKIKTQILFFINISFDKKN